MSDLNLPKKRKMQINAALWKRITAFLIDFVIIVFISSPLFSAVGNSFLQQTQTDFFSTINKVSMQVNNNPDLVAKLNIVNFLFMIIAFLYFTFLEYKINQTPGKMILNLNVKSTKKKKKISFWQAAVRNLFLLINFIIIIDIFYYLFKGDRLSDVLAKTKIIEVISA
ncbi:hypothetical protein GF327_01765 [Candidatus Woesearchaeota archaeon]|nr:hypothetical protein [Candidatus Woesearchaeota archaeon]